MQSKNMIIAIALCLGVLFGWGYLAKYMGWVQVPSEEELAAQQKLMQEQEIAAKKAEAEAAEARKLPAFVPAEGRDIVVDTPLYKASVYTGGAILRSFELKQYHKEVNSSSPMVNLVNAETAAVAPLGLLINGQPSWSTGKWSADAQDVAAENGKPAVLAFTGEVDGIRVVRTLSFSADSYLIKENVSLTVLGDAPRSARVAYTVASDKTGLSEGPYDSMRIAWNIAGKQDEEADAKDLEAGVKADGKVSWAGAMNTYFLSAILPSSMQQGTFKGLLQNGVYRTAVEESDILLTPGQEKNLSVSYWIGPKERERLLSAPNDLVTSIDLGMFSLIAKGLLWLLNFFQQYAHNWGISIILLTVLIKAVFWPLTAKSYSSMEKMKKLQPLMQNLREKYKDDKEALNREVMGLYKTYGVNPASGCVPILIQLPVFFGLYQALLTSIELRHASFMDFLPGTDILWLADLSSKDPLYITPIVMGVTMFLQQRMSPPVGDPTQRKIMMFLPIIFTVMFLNFPAGLVVYWLVNNVLSILQQWLMIRKNARKAA